MAASSASLVVKVSADITDFSKNLDAMTKGVDKAADRMAKFGDALTIGITVPVAAAAAALFKFGADAESAGLRMDRTFGALSGSMKDALEKMTATVPETAADLENLAVHLDNVVQGLGIAPANAASMSESLLKVAADASAVAHVPLPEALDALSHALSGRGRELIQFGLGFNQAEVKQRAMQLGLLQTGNTLTETGTALASFSLIMDHATRIQGAAEQSVGDADKQWQFLTRDLKKIAEDAGQVLLPALSSVVGVAKDVVTFFSDIPPTTIKVIGAIAGVAAIVGPSVAAMARFSKAIFDVRAAFKLLSAEGSILGFFASLTNPIGLVVGGIVLLTAAVGALAVAWEFANNKMREHGYLTKSELADKDNAILGPDPALAAFVGKNFGGKGGGGKNAPTDFNPKDAFQQLQENASIVSAAFDSAVAHGQGLSAIDARVNDLHAQALDLLTSQGGQLTKNAEIASKVADQMQRFIDIEAVSNAPTTEAAQEILNRIAARSVDVGALGAGSRVDEANKYAADFAARSAASQYSPPFNAQGEAKISLRLGAQANANDLDKRLAELGQSVNGMTPGFDAAKLAAVQYGEAQRSENEQVALAFETIKIKLGPLGGALDGFSDGMQRAVVSIANSVQAFAQSIIDTIGGSGKNAGNGRGIGGLLGGIAGSFFGPVGAAVGSALGSGIGGEVGGLIDSSQVTHPSLDQVQALRAQGFTVDEIAKQLHAPVNEIRVDFQELDKSLGANTNAINALTESITNIPQFFKIGYYNFIASPPRPGAPLGPVNPPPQVPFRGNPAIGGSHPDQVPSGDVHFNAPVTFAFGDITSMSDLYAEIKQRVNRDKSIGSTSGRVFSRA